MNELGFVDFLVITTAAVVSWRMHQAANSGQEHAPLRPPVLNAGPAAPARLEPDLPSDVGPQLRDTLRRICLAVGYPGVATFLDGAKLAYEAISGAFAQGDMGAHAQLVAEDVIRTFTEAIDLRKAKGESIELTFVGFKAADVVDAGLDDGIAWLDVRFVSDLVSVTQDRNGRVVAGVPNRIVRLAERWTFERQLISPRSHWLLTRTVADA